MKKERVTLFTLRGKVLVYKGRGTSLGFPTANIEVNEEVLDGIYVGFVEIFDTSYQALIFVGSPITFNETQRFAEAYLLDFSGNLYGLDVVIHFIKRLRDVKKFANANLLVLQIQEDERMAREFFAAEL